MIISVRIFSTVIRMEFGMSKCAVLVMNKGTYTRSGGIRLPDQQQIRDVNVDKGYKYLDMLEADGMKDELMKEAFTKEYISRVRKIFKSKLNGVYTITTINIRAFLIVQYTAGKDDKNWSGRQVSNYRAFRPQGDIDGLY